MPKPTLKTLLAELEADDLREVVIELCKLSPQNKTFVELFLRGSDDVDTAALVRDITARVRACFFTGPTRPKPKPDLAQARKVVTEHERLAADYPRVAAEASIAYVEAVVDYAAALEARYRYVSQATVEAAVRMLERYVRAALARPMMLDAARGRVGPLVPFTYRFGKFLRALQAADASVLDGPDDRPPFVAFRFHDDETYRVEYDRAPSSGDDG